MKKQLKRADKSGAQIALILGDNELAEKSVMVKYLRGQSEQKNVALKEVTQLLSALI
jgi:histidyl-tRNA synthetase